MKLSELLQYKDLDFATFMSLKIIQMAFGDRDLNLEQLKQEYPNMNDIFNKIEEEINNG